MDFVFSGLFGRSQSRRHDEDVNVRLLGHVWRRCDGCIGF